MAKKTSARGRETDLDAELENGLDTADLERELGSLDGAHVGPGDRPVGGTGESAPGLPVRVKSRYTVKGAGETERSFDVVVPAEKLGTIGTELEIFTLYELVFARINASAEVMLSHAEIVPATPPAAGCAPG